MLNQLLVVHVVHHIRPPLRPLLRCLFSTRLRVKVTQTQTHLDPSSSCTSPSLSPLTRPPPVSSLDIHNLQSFHPSISKNIKTSPLTRQLSALLAVQTFASASKHILHSFVHLFYLCTPKTSLSSRSRQRNTTNTKKAQHSTSAIHDMQRATSRFYFDPFQSTVNYNDHSS